MQRKIKKKCKHDWLNLDQALGIEWCKECGTLKYREGKAVSRYKIPNALVTIETKLRKERLCAICQSTIDGGSL